MEKKKRKKKLQIGFSEQLTRIFEKIPMLDQGKAMRGLDDWGFTVKQRQAFRKVLNGAVNLT